MEIVITFLLMTVILHVSNDSELHKLTGLCAGALVATYITIEAPISGMSIERAGRIIPLEAIVLMFAHVEAPETTPGIVKLYESPRQSRGFTLD
jgi:aquaporin Z